MGKQKIKFPVLTALAVLLAFTNVACGTPPADREAAYEGENRSASGGAPRIAVLVTADDLAGNPFVEDILIGVSRTAQEFGGTIVGREETISFGGGVEFTMIPTASGANEIEQQFPSLNLEQYDLVFGCGWMYTDPLVNAYVNYPQTHFVLVDSAKAVEPGDNLTFLLFNIKDAAFLAGVVAGDKLGGVPLGFVGGMDIPLIRNDFLGGFSEGLEYVDSLNGSKTELMVEFGDSFTDRTRGYELAMDLYGRGVQCIYQAAGETGFGVLEAAGEMGKWVIGVDTDQGLEFAQEPFGKWILTSTVKRWGTGVYLVCKEYLVTGIVPSGVHFVGLNEGCVDMAVNPYNAPYLMEQMELIASVRESLLRGEIPTIVPQEQSEVWKSRSVSTAARTPLAVNDPEFSKEIDASYGPTLQKALSTALHESGRYRVISREQKNRLLEEISSSLDITADEKQQLEVGRLIAAEAIVFVDLSKVGSSYILDTKVVDVQTGIALSACSESFESIEEVFDGLSYVVGKLSAY